MNRRIKIETNPSTMGHDRMNETKTPERRNIKRLKLVYYLQVYERTTNAPIGSVVDISTQGMKLVSEKYYPPETVFSMSILLPEGSIFGESVEIDGRCRWCTEEPETSSYECGFEFIKKADSGVFVVKALIDDLQNYNVL
jgi:hypothetical protein